MQVRHALRRAAAMVAVSGMMAGGIAVVAAMPASAVAQTAVVVSRTSWAYTDVRHPLRTFTGDGPARVGAWRDDAGEYHSSKAYFTFALPDLRGVRFFGAEARASEIAVKDCTKDRATELWATDPAPAPTWVHQPRERSKLPGPTSPRDVCPASRLDWDASTVVQDALAAGRSTVTLALRMPDGRQFDPAYGRQYRNDPQLILLINRPPGTPTDLGTRLGPCDQLTFEPERSPDLFAFFPDADASAPLAVTFAIWPVDQPTQRTELTTTTAANVRAFVHVRDALTDGTTYEFAAQSRDDTDTSPWSAPCRFTVDATPPSALPEVSSVDYPVNCPFPFCGGQGVPGRFTFTANGVADVVGFRYGSQPEAVTFAAADRLGGSATVDHAPAFPGLNRLFVRSVDRAGNISAPQLYQFFVRDVSPRVTCDPQSGGLGEPRTCTFAPGLPGVVSYRYSFDRGPEVTAPANSDGIAVVTVRPITPLNPRLSVTSVTASGFEANTDIGIPVEPSAPCVHSDTYPDFDFGGGVGVPGDFVFTPHMPNVADYVFVFDDGPEQIVPAGQDGSATITYTPTVANDHLLTVVARTADGVRSDQQFYLFSVNP